MSFPWFRAVGGVLLVLAGVLAYFGVTFGVAAWLIFVVGGAALLVAVASGHRARAGDIAIFAIGLLVLSGVTVGYNTGAQTASYTGMKSDVQANGFSLVVTANAGSVDITFTNRTDLAYQVNFTRPVGVFSVWPSGADSVSNSTEGGVFNLDVTASGSAVSVALGRGYVYDLAVSTETGSVSLEATGNETIHDVSLSASTGSVSAVLNSASIRSITMSSSTGSVSLQSDHLRAAERDVPVTLSSSLGSVSLRADLSPGQAVSITANTGLGSLNHELPGFIVTQDTRTNLAASVGDVATAQASFIVSATTSLGSVSVTMTPTGS